jgi:hypothetical protein
VERSEERERHEERGKFVLPEGSGYDAYAAADAWRETVAFLDHHLGA